MKTYGYIHDILHGTIRIQILGEKGDCYWVQRPNGGGWMGKLGRFLIAKERVDIESNLVANQA